MKQPIEHWPLVGKPQQQPPHPVTCRECGHRHQATICNVCKVPTPHFAVIRGGKS